jgi:hypothetical protein
MNIFKNISSEEILEHAKNVQSPPEEIPDLDALMDSIIEFLEYINTSEMQQLEEANPVAFENHLDLKFRSFSLKYYGIFKMLLDKKRRAENVNKLINLFSKLNKVKDGDMSMDKAYEEYTEGLNGEYIYPKYGGKDNFEQHIKKQHAEKQKKEQEKK